MMGNNPKLDLVNVDVYTKFGQILFIHSLKDTERKQNSDENQGPQLHQNLPTIMTGNIPKLGPVNVDAHTKFGKILSNRSQDMVHELFKMSVPPDLNRSPRTFSQFWHV